MTGQFLQLTMAVDAWSRRQKIHYDGTERLDSLWRNSATPFFPDAVETLIRTLKNTPGFAASNAVQSMTVNTFTDEPISTVNDLQRYLARKRVGADPKANGVATAVSLWTSNETEFSSGTTLRSLWARFNDPESFIPDGADELCDRIRSQPIFRNNHIARSLDSSMFGGISGVGDLYRELQRG
jgi:hypothetical protein